MVIMAIGAASALAATISGNGTLVGTKGADKITAGNADDAIYGLGGGDSITAGNGNDSIDADGQCPPGVKSGDYPNGLPAGEYCEDMQGQNQGNAGITAGNGNDTIFAGGGQNAISAGCGNDTIYGGPVGDAISAGANGNCQANDQIYLGLGANYGGSSVATGHGANVIHAQNGVSDQITCLKGNVTTVYADRSDVVKDCAHVIYTADPNPGPIPRLDRRLKARKLSHRVSTRRLLADLRSHHYGAALALLRHH